MTRTRELELVGQRRFRAPQRCLAMGRLCRPTLLAMIRFRWLPVLVAAAAVVASCSGSESATVEEASITSPTASGGQIDFGSLEGTDTVLWFWAPW